MQHARTAGLAAQRRVLIVDDEPKISRTLAEHFSYNGYDVRNVLRGEDALALIDTYHPHIVVLDILMPGLGGTETLRHLKECNPRPKVVVISAADQDEIEGALKLGPDFYMTKPVDFDELTHIVTGLALCPFRKRPTELA